MAYFHKIESSIYLTDPTHTPRKPSQCLRHFHTTFTSHLTIMMSPHPTSQQSSCRWGKFSLLGFGGWEIESRGLSVSHFCRLWFFRWFSSNSFTLTDVAQKSLHHRPIPPKRRARYVRRVRVDKTINSLVNSAKRKATKFLQTNWD